MSVSSTAVSARPAKDTGQRPWAKGISPIPERTPMSAFCGLPTSEQALPTFEETARAIRYGAAGCSSRLVTRKSNGANIRQIVSFMNSAERTPGESEDAALHDLEEARQLEVAEHDHHAEQEEDRVEVDRALRLVESDDAERDHRHGPQQRPGGPAEVEPRNPLDPDDEVRHQEDQERGRHATALL